MKPEGREQTDHRARSALCNLCKAAVRGHPAVGEDIEPTSRLYEQSPVKEPAQVHLWNAMLGKVTRTNNSGLPSQLEDELCFASYRHLLQNVCRYNYVPTFCNTSVWVSQLLFLSRQSGW